MTRFLTAHFSKFLELIVGQHGKNFTAEQQSAKPYEISVLTMVLKTKCLFIGTRHKISLLPRNSDICLGGHLRERVDSYKCPGIQMDETLS